MTDTVAIPAVDLESLGVGRFDGTVIYVHGIANKPIASVLKCQWDRALFGTGMGQRTRMVHWVNRDRYPDPYPATCNDADFLEDIDLNGSEESLVDDSQSSRIELAQTQIDKLLEPNWSSLGPKKREKIQTDLLRLARRIDSRFESQAVRTSDEILPLPRWARDRITRLFTRYLLNDVYDYFFDREKQRQIDAKFLSRVSSGGPFIVIGHSLGSVIAYKNLMSGHNFDRDRVRLFLTLGSPLGLQEVQDNLQRTLGVKQLSKPISVRRWINLADRMDPVAADARIADDIDPSIVDLSVKNRDRPRHPHSATGYLSVPECQEFVRRVSGAAFAQPISFFSIARDLTDQIEESIGPAGSDSEMVGSPKHHVLIELTDHRGDGLEQARERLMHRIKEALGEASYESIEFTKLERYLAADLTSIQIENLGPVLQHEQVGRIWSDSEKQCLSTGSTVAREDPIQSAAAARLYGADGNGVEWAVLDTGVHPDHPHFQTHGNIRTVWDCTSRGEMLGQTRQNGIDRHGHGTHVAAIIAGVIAGADQSGADQSGVRQSKARDGVAAKTGIHSYKVLDASGRGRDSYIIRALDHIASINESASRIVIHGVNLSLGGPFDPETYGCGHSPICRELRRLWRQGVLVVVAAGNAGFAELQSSRGALRANLDLSIGDPANLEESIAVGSVHLANPLTYGTSYFSSRGPTADGRQKPDLVAPGERIPSANYAFRSAEDYIELSGTSMAAPHVSGLLAAFLSQRRELIGEPERVKSILLENCTTLNRDPYVQGAGLPNLVRMMLST